MRLRQFSGPTMAAALDRVREALGPDALILETRAVPGGGGAVEVTAAVDDTPAPAVAPTAADAALAAEVRELSEVVRALVGRAWGARSATLGEDLGRLYGSLVASGVDGVIAASLIEEAAARMAGGAELEAAITGAMSSGIAFDALEDDDGRPLPGRGPLVRIFFGPPGDGKTTTIAKLAGRALMERRRRVALVSADTYRLGGAEELAAYGRILGVPHAAVADARELRESVARFGDVDEVLIDTAGVSMRDEGRRTELQDLGAALAGARRLLVVSATTAPAVTRHVCAALAALRPHACVVTKVDEGPLAGVLEACWRRALPIAFFGTGRGVPRDLEAASPARMAALLRAA